MCIHLYSQERENLLRVGQMIVFNNNGIDTLCVSSQTMADVIKTAEASSGKTAMTLHCVALLTDLRVFNSLLLLIYKTMACTYLRLYFHKERTRKYFNKILENNFSVNRIRLSNYSYNHWQFYYTWLILCQMVCG